MVDIKAIQSMGYESPDTGIPDRVKDRVDKAVSGALTKIWRGTLEVAASGFGKGVLATAALVLAFFMISAGVSGYLGNIPSAIPGVAATVDTAVKMSIGHALGFLTSAGGLLTLAVGGAMGSIGDTQKYQDKLTVEMAKTEAARLEQLRGRALEKSVSIEPQSGVQKSSNGRAALSLSRALHSGELQIQPNSGFAAREDARRASSEILGKAF